MLDMPVAPPRLSICRYSAVRSPPFQKLFSKFSASSWARDSSARLRKMMVQENSEASSSSPMTHLHDRARLQHQSDYREFIVHRCTFARVFSVMKSGKRPRDGRTSHRRRPPALRLRRAASSSVAAMICLRKRIEALPFGHRRAGDAQLVVEPRGLAVVHVHLGHREHEAVLLGELAAANGPGCAAIRCARAP